MRKAVKALLAALFAYALLVLLLLAAERGNPNATIRSLGDALWYSVVTMTTVGYGDLTPVTPTGRVLGLLFALCSVGILAGLIALLLRLIRGELFPLLRLRCGRGKPWYVFSEANEEAVTLAKALLGEQDALVIFPAGTAEEAPAGAVCLTVERERLRKLHAGQDGMAFFCLDGNAWLNRSRAAAIAREGYPAYCMAEPAAEDIPEKLHTFSLPEAVARRYWQDWPLGEEEENIVFIGGGKTAEALLERALLINVYPAGRSIRYHCFALGEDFALFHSELVAALAAEQQGDRLRFYSGSFAAERELLSRADRVILCDERDDENLRVYEALRSYYVLSGALHLRLRRPQEGLCSFGSLEETLRPEMVMRDELDRRAMLLHAIYSEGSADKRAWRELSPFLRASNIAAADHIDTKLRILLGEGAAEAEDRFRLACERFEKTQGEERERLRETEHRRWLRFYRFYNWRYAPRRDDRERLHPSLLPYEQLSGEERCKDDDAWRLLGRIAAKGERDG